MNQNHTVALTTLGCKLNFSETSTISRQFKNVGYSVVKFDQFSDIYVINTCSVTENADKQFKSYVSRALKINQEDAALINQYITIAFSAFQWEEVVKGISRAKSMDINKEGKYDLMLGIAYFELDKRSAAEKAFNQARLSKKYKDQGAAWLEYLEALKG